MHFCSLSRVNNRTLLRYVKIAGLLTLVVLFVPPFRNAVLASFLPGAWLEHSTYQLIRMVMDNQHFPIDDPFKHPPFLDGAASVKVDMSDLSKYVYRQDPYQAYHDRVKKLKLIADTSKDKGEKEAASEKLFSLASFKPSMTLEERAQLMFTLDVFMKACRQHGIVFFVFEGTLLGAYRHHGLVPWDDDVDVAVNASDWQLVQRVLGSIPGFTLFAPPGSQWKFYLTDLPAFQDKPFKYPYIDIFFFSHRGDYVWGKTWGTKNHLMVRASHLFPLTTVRWEMLSGVPAPRCVRRMVVSNYGSAGCQTPKYNHRTNEVRYGFQTGKADCSVLHSLFPFVFRFRHPKQTGFVLESRKIGDALLENLTVQDEPAECLE